jgi:predicted membrane-bound mannosyltransferase
MSYTIFSAPAKTIILYKSCSVYFGVFGRLGMISSSTEAALVLYKCYTKLKPFSGKKKLQTK